jgi:hypothetical protein
MKDFNDNKGSRLKEMTVSIRVWTIDIAWMVTHSNLELRSDRSIGKSKLA